MSNFIVANPPPRRKNVRMLAVLQRKYDLRSIGPERVCGIAAVAIRSLQAADFTGA